MRRPFILLLLAIAFLQAGCVDAILWLPILYSEAVASNPAGNPTGFIDPTHECIAERMALQRGYQAEECSTTPEVLEKYDPLH